MNQGHGWASNCSCPVTLHSAGSRLQAERSIPCHPESARQAGREHTHRCLANLCSQGAQRRAEGTLTGMNRAPFPNRETFTPICEHKAKMCVCLCMHVFSCSVVSDSFATQRTIASHGPLSTGFSRQESWSGLPFPSPFVLHWPLITALSPRPRPQVRMSCSSVLTLSFSPGCLTNEISPTSLASRAH